MHATAATRQSTKARAALGPIASNTSSFAEAPGCATPRGAERGASFGLATAESSPDGAVDRRSATEAPCARHGHGAAPRRRHEPYPGFQLTHADAIAPALPAGYQWCGPGVHLHPAYSMPPRSRAAEAAAALAPVAATPAVTVVAACAAPTPVPSEAPAAAAPAAAAALAAAARAVRVVTSVPAPAAAPSGGHACAPPSGLRSQHNTSVSSDVSEPSTRPKYEGRRAVQTRLVATVQFRFRTAPFTVPPELEHVCEPDAAVVVQGDRGEDAGTVLCVERDPCAAVPHCAVTRLASPADLHRVRVASEFAVLVLERVCVLAKVEATRNPQFQQLVVVDVDVQMDLNKVYVHYTSPWRVQFGNFTRALWQALPFKPRIWMNQINFADTSRMSIKGRASRNNPAPPKNPSPPKGRAPRHERPSAGGPGPQRRQHDGEHPK